MPDILVDDKASSSSVDRSHSLGSLIPIRKGAIAPGNRFIHDSLRSATPQAAVASLPKLGHTRVCCLVEEICNGGIIYHR